MLIKHGLARGVFACLRRAAALCLTITAVATNINAEDVAVSATEAFGNCFGASEDICLWGMIQKNEPFLIPTLILIVMAAYALELMVDRWLTIALARRQSLSYQLRVGAALFHKRFEEAAALSVEYPRSPVAFAVLAFVRSNSNDGADTRNPCMQEWQRAIVIKSNEFRQRIWILGAIGCTAPLVGVLYACVRITQTFQACYAAGGSGFAPVANEIALATWGISFSIVIAVPAIWAYKYLCAQNATILLEMERFSLAIIEQLSDQPSSLSSNTSSHSYITQELNKNSTRRIAR